jgi:thymidylate kinase
MELINYTSILFSDLNRKSINYCVLRNFEHLPLNTGNSDLDILIHKNDVAKFIYILESFIQINKLNLVSVISDKHCPKYCISNENWGIQIDVFQESVFYGDNELITSDTLFQNTLVYNGVKVLDPKIGALLSFLKELLNNKNCTAKYIEDLQNQFQLQKIATNLLIQFDLGFITYFKNNFNELNNGHYLKLYDLSRKTHKKSSLNGFVSKIQRLFHKPGYTVAFLGTDGSGKSTIIELITPILNEAFHKAVYYEHLRPNHFPSIARLLGNKNILDEPVTDPHGGSVSGYLGSFFRWAYYSLDYTFGFYIKIFTKKAFKSCVWIFDRYYYDYLIDPKRSRINLPKWIFKLGQFIIPEPDIIICLGTDAQTIHKRKPELPLLEVERQVKDLKKFAENHKRAVWIDTGKSIETAQNDTMKAIIKVMAKRFENVKLN